MTQRTLCFDGAAEDFQLFLLVFVTVIMGKTVAIITVAFSAC